MVSSDYVVMLCSCEKRISYFIQNRETKILDTVDTGRMTVTYEV